MGRTFSEIGPGAAGSSNLTADHSITVPTTEDIFPRSLGRARRGRDANEDVIFSDNDGDDGDDDGEYATPFGDTAYPDNTPGGTLLWPCPSCLPDNATGFRCPNPIPAPSEEALGEVSPLRRHMPQRGERWPLINDPFRTYP